MYSNDGKSSGKKMVSTNISCTVFFVLLYSCLHNQSKTKQCLRFIFIFLNKRTFRVCSSPSSTVIRFSSAPHTHPFLSFIFRVQRSAPGARWRTGTHADRQSRESRVRKTSALHWKVPVPSRSSSQLFRFGEMSFTQMACRR